MSVCVCVYVCLYVYVCVCVFGWGSEREGGGGMGLKPQDIVYVMIGSDPPYTALVHGIVIIINSCEIPTSHVDNPTCCLLVENVPATGLCISETDLLRQLHVPSH